MGSYIEQFQGEHEKESDLVITIDGPSGAGKGSVAEQVGEILDVPIYSAGDFFREIAKEKGMTVEELSKKADRNIDVEVDRRTLEKGLKEDCVIDSRIAGKVLGDYADLKIYLTAKLEERARRSLEDLKEGKRQEEENVESLEQTKEKIEARDQNNNRRYRNYYEIDPENLEVYDVIIDNTEMSVEQQRENIKELLEKRFGDKV